MKRQILILFLTILSLTTFAQQATLPVGAVPYGSQYYKAPDGSVWMGATGKNFTRVTEKRMLDSLSNRKQTLSTGLVTHAALSATIGATTFSISAGLGVVADYTDPYNVKVKTVTITARSGISPTYRTSAAASYIAIDSLNNIVQSASPFTDIQRRDLIIIGAVIHSNLSTINAVNNLAAPIIASVNQLHDLFEAVGSLNTSGNKYTFNGGNLNINKSAGDLFKLGVNFVNDWKSPNKLTIAAQIALTFRYRTQTGTEFADATVIDPGFYDVAGTRTAIPGAATRFSIQRITIFQSGLTRIQYGQAFYDNKSDAVAALEKEPFVVEPNIAQNGIFRAYLVVRKNATNLNDLNQAEFFEVGKFGATLGNAGGAVTSANIIAALGYTPENVANKTTDLTSPDNTKYPTSLTIANAIPYNFVTPEQFGAVADGVTDATTAITNAINSLKPVYFGNGTYLVTGNIQIPANSTLMGFSDLTTIKTTTNAPIFLIKGGAILVSKLRFLGSGKDSGNTLQHGIVLNGDGNVNSYRSNVKIENCVFDQMGGAGYYSIGHVGAAPNRGSALISNCYATNCNYGFFLDVRSEYNSISNSTAGRCNTGYAVYGGNNTWVGGQMTDCAINVFIGTGTNDGHGQIVGAKINHATTYNIKSDGLTQGMLFSDCMVYAANNYINNSAGIKFSNCEFSMAGNTFSILTSTKVEFYDNKFVSTNPTFTLTGTTDIVWSNTNFFSGTTPAGIANTRVLSAGGLSAGGSVSASAIGIGVVPNAATGFQNTYSLTSGATAYGNLTQSTIMSPVTAVAYGYRSVLSTEASAFSVASVQHFEASQGVIGAGSSMVDVNGFVASSSLSGSTKTAGFLGAVVAGTDKYNLKMDGTAQNYLKGSLGIDVLVPTEKLDVLGNGKFSGTLNVGSSISATQFRLSALNTAPASASATGTTGEIRIDANFIYVCTATNTWKRVAIATW